MGNITFGYPNRADETTLSGGSWETTLPLANLKDRIIAHVARSTDDATSSTKFDIDLGKSRMIGLFALAGHNLSVDATIKITGATSQANLTSSPFYTTGWIDVWPTGAIPLDMLEWEDDNFWLGTITAEARAAYNTPFIKAITKNSLRWWRVEIDDTTNPDGYVQVGRLFLSDSWTPTYNMSYGASLAVEDPGSVEESEGGTEFFDVRAKFRTLNLDLDFVSENEAYARILEIQRQLGTRGELLVIPDPDDTNNGFRRNMLGRLVKIEPIVNTFTQYYKVSIEIKEIL